MQAERDGTMWLCLSKAFAHYQHTLCFLSLVAGKSRAWSGVHESNAHQIVVDGVGAEPGSLGRWTSAPVLSMGIHLLVQVAARCWQGENQAGCSIHWFSG